MTPGNDHPVQHHALAVSSIAATRISTDHKTPMPGVRGTATTLYQQSLDAAGTPYDELDVTTLRQNWPQWKVPDDTVGMYQAESGLVDIRKATETHLNLANATIQAGLPAACRTTTTSSPQKTPMRGGRLKVGMVGAGKSESFNLSTAVSVIINMARLRAVFDPLSTSARTWTRGPPALRRRGQCRQIRERTRARRALHDRLQAAQDIVSSSVRVSLMVFSGSGSGLLAESSGYLAWIGLSSAAGESG
ncbi:hypothetical protein ACIBQ1_03635 [Nonomuraea sp. NPDC050153]|uniref:hypothetical protein n=1 Tax=Nonomuraea sp. NPDC050153 TaxID=3364359 RepID=UPI0037A2F2E6